MIASPESFPLLKELLADQRRLATPVARYAAAHAAGPQSIDAPTLEPVYRDLIPLSAPKPGEHYAFEVELDACTGCKACVSACHSLNGLDDTETWRDVGLIIGGDYRHPVQQTVTTACHHCADPACLNGCPVLAYEKDPATGIVRHLDDQCIGCQYCVLKCPYDVPKYNPRLGIVRKCDMCHSRLAEGEAPACVQACPTHAIRIVTVTTHRSGVTKADTTAFLPAAPDPSYTQPTTRYVSERPAPVTLVASDIATLRPQPPHWPLAIMLTLMPLAVGIQLMVLVGARSVETETAAGRLLLLSVIAGALGLAASVAHLGRPLRAWRIFLGWRKSWLSREAMMLGAWFPIALLALFQPAWLPLAATLGVLGLFCSVMIYVDTRRVFWRWSQTGPRFFGSAFLLGAAATFAHGLAPLLSAIVVACATLVKLGCEARVMRPLDAWDEEEVPTPAVMTSRLLAGPLRGVFGSRIALALVAGLLLPALAVAGVLGTPGPAIVLATVLIADVMERHLFFRAVDAPKMPGLPGVTGQR